jgi:adenylate kinase
VIKVIFIGGVHGVGKTFFCKKVSEKIDFPHYSSSDLIAKQKRELLGPDKRVADTKGNQDYLFDALESLKNNDNKYLLDGHFCLLNKDGNIVKLPIDTFSKLSPSALVILTDSSKAIAQRLYDRDNQNYSIDLLDQFQNEELNYANQISSKQNIPIYICKNGEPIESLISFIKNVTY